MKPVMPHMLLAPSAIYPMVRMHAHVKAHNLLDAHALNGLAVQEVV